jgi:hypothetical protein
VKAVQTYIKARQVWGPLTVPPPRRPPAQRRHHERRDQVSRPALLLWAAFLRVGAGGVARQHGLGQHARRHHRLTIAILMFVILTLAGPIGELIGAIIAAIDALVRLICNSFLTEEQQEGKWGQLLCGGISGLFKNMIQRMFYSGTILVEMEPEDYDRLTMGNFNASDLLHPERGVTAGNAVSTAST